MFATSYRTSKFMSKNLENYKETETFTIVFGCFLAALSIMNRILTKICDKISIRIFIDLKGGVNLNHLVEF